MYLTYGAIKVSLIMSSVKKVWDNRKSWIQQKVHDHNHELTIEQKYYLHRQLGTQIQDLWSWYTIFTLLFSSFGIYAENQLDVLH